MAFLRLLTRPPLRPFPDWPAAWPRCARHRLTCQAPRREDSCVSSSSSVRSIIRPPPQRDAASVDPTSNTKRFASLSQESLSCPAIAHARKNDLLEVATTLRSMMQYGGELVRRICSSKTDGRGAALPCLPN